MRALLRDYGMILMLMALCVFFSVATVKQQSAEGTSAADHVVATVGMERFNTVWTSPETLPLSDEVDEPQRWIDRVL